MAGVKFIAKCHIQWIEESSKHGHFCLVYSDQTMQEVIQKRARGSVNPRGVGYLCTI